MDELTPAEAKFFETGELPPELAAEHTPSQIAADATVPPLSEAPGTVTAPSPATPAAAPDPFLLNLQRQLAEAEAARHATEQRLNDLVAQLQTVQAPTAPDPETDPFGHMQHQVTNIAAAIKQLQDNLGTQTAQQNQSAQLNQFVDRIRTMRDDFAKTVPDFPDAYKHVRDMRASDLRDAGVPEHMLPSAMLQDEMALAQNALQLGRNPAAVLYDMAKRHGYTAKVTAAPATPAVKLAQLQAGHAAAKNVPHGGVDVTLTPESLKDASETDLDKLVQSDDMWHKVIGGGQAKDIFS